MRMRIRVGLLLYGIYFLAAPPMVFSQNQETSTRPEGWQGSWPGDWQDAKPAPQKDGIAPGPQGSSPSGKQVMEISPHPQSVPESPRRQAAIPPRSQSEAPHPTQLLTVTVTDPQGRYVSGLQPEDFEVYEDAEQQKITYFNTGQHEPVSLGFIVDVSTSMIPKLDHALFALQELLATVPARSETFIEAFAGEPVTLQDFTDSRPVLRATLPYLRRELRRQGSLCSMEMADRGMMARHCGTSLYDALLDGLQHIKKGGLRKKALIVISDGLDNNSGGTLEEVVHRARESGVLIYAIGIGQIAQRSSFFGASDASIDIPVLKQTSELTGGRLFAMTADDVLGNANTLAAATQIIARELSSQYSLGYTPSRPGSHHREVQVVVRRKETDNLTVRSQKGYTLDSQERRERRQAQHLQRW
jgi:Ca-activated chloride channel family protein